MDQIRTITSGCYGFLRDALSDRLVLACIAALLLANAVLVGFHVAHFVTARFGLGEWLRDPAFSLESSLGYAQIFNSLQTLALVGLLLRLGQRTRQALYLALAAVFLLILVDDAVGLNQAVGARLLALIPLHDYPRVKAQSLAEMLFYGAMALPALGLLTLGFRAATAFHRALGTAFMALLALLTLFATVVDLAHLAFMRAFFGSRLFWEVLEEGGEMATLSLALVLALALNRWLAAARTVPARAIAG